jgi:hypothetical protein
MLIRDLMRARRAEEGGGNGNDPTCQQAVNPVTPVAPVTPVTETLDAVTTALFARTKSLGRATESHRARTRGAKAVVDLQTKSLVRLT